MFNRRTGAGFLVILAVAIALLARSSDLSSADGPRTRIRIQNDSSQTVYLHRIASGNYGGEIDQPRAGSCPPNYEKTFTARPNDRYHVNERTDGYRTLADTSASARAGATLVFRCRDAGLNFAGVTVVCQLIGH